jgi:acyl carrier protein
MTMSLDEFRRHVAREIAREPEAIPAEADLRDDLGLDSIEMFLLVIAVEDLGAEFPEEMLPHVRTLADAYHHFVTTAGHNA